MNNEYGQNDNIHVLWEGLSFLLSSAAISVLIVPKEINSNKMHYKTRSWSQEFNYNKQTNKQKYIL